MDRLKRGYMSFYLPQTSKIEGEELTLKSYQTTDISKRYRDISGLNSSSKIVTGDKLRLDLSSCFDEQILTGSARFKVGADTFLDRTGTLYRNVDPSNNSGIASGVIQYGTGKVEIDSWTPNADNTITLESLTTTTDLPPVNKINFRTPIIPIRPQSLTVVVGTLAYGQLTLTADENGVIETNRAHGKVSYDTGFVSIYFYTKTRVTETERRAEIEANDSSDCSCEYQRGSRILASVLESGSMLPQYVITRWLILTFH